MKAETVVSVLVFCKKFNLLVFLSTKNKIIRFFYFLRGNKQTNKNN